MMSALKVLIVEDEILIASHIKNCIVNHGFSAAGIAINYIKAIELIERHEVDVILLDVSISGERSGIELAKTINEKYKIPFIYLTSYSDAKTLEALKETFPIAYLSKPINEISLTTTLDIFRSNKSRKAANHFSFQVGNTKYKIDLEELQFIKSDHVYVELILKSKKLILRNSLKNMIDLLPDGIVEQVNRSTLVNPLQIKKMKGNFIEIGEHVIKISKSYKKDFEGKS